MQATIYVSEEAIATAIAIKDLDYYDRTSLSDDEQTDLSKAAGYYLKNANKLNLAVLPTPAHVALTLVADNPDHTQCTVTMPASLRGCIFENAPSLPGRYADIVAYWSGEALNAADSRAVHFQNPQNEYLVELRPTSTPDQFVSADRLVSEGVVVSISGLTDAIKALAANDFVEIVLPVDAGILGIEPDQFQSPQSYRIGSEQSCEHIFLQVGDIRRSPNPDHVLIDLLRHELLDYGYWY